MSSVLDETISAWLKEYGTECVAKSGGVYYKVPIPERYRLLTYLIQAFKDKGYEKEFFSRSSTQTAIAAVCFSTVVYDKEKRKNGIATVLRELREIVAEFWPDEEVKNAKNKLEERVKTAESVVERPAIREPDRVTLKDAPRSTDILDQEAADLLGLDADLLGLNK